MKHIAGKALKVGTGIAVVGVCAAVVVGWGDIRKFRQMNNM